MDSNESNLTITIKNLPHFSIGTLITLLKRSVGLYTSFVNINAYHQLKVEAGIKAAQLFFELQRIILMFLSPYQNNALTFLRLRGKLAQSKIINMFLKFANICRPIIAQSSIILADPPFNSNYTLV
jgi:hypothetical protein